MAKLIAVYGAPGAGKTCVSIKVGMALYLKTANNDAPIYYLSPDLIVPTNGLLFPNYKPDEVRSLADVFDNSVITEDIVLANTVTIKSMKNFGALGFKAGDTEYSFPRPTPEKINALFSILNDLAGYVIVDCAGEATDAISRKAMQTADAVLRVVTPDVKGMAWYSSHNYSERQDNTDLFNVVNITEKDLHLPVSEVGANLKTVAGELPFSEALKQQMLDGELYEALRDNKYSKKVSALAQKLI